MVIYINNHIKPWIKCFYTLAVKTIKTLTHEIKKVNVKVFTAGKYESGIWDEKKEINISMPPAGKSGRFFWKKVILRHTES